ncbi:MAG: FtsQ-type POTRA domain-containing protein [Acidobacteriota bacterium]|nr:FtsQ-type POTRA domain-containing protein [Acidobacteriota bacterium]
MSRALKAEAMLDPATGPDLEARELDNPEGPRTTARPRPVPQQRPVPQRPWRPATAGHPHRVPGPSSFDDNIVPRFRRRRAPAHNRHRWRRTWRVLRSLLLLAWSVGLPMALVAWLFTAPQLSFRQLEVHPSPRVQEAWVAQQLATLRGRNLLMLPLEEVRSRLLEHPWVAGAAVQKRLPDGLEIELVEHQPAALLELGEQALLVNPRGEIIAPLGPEEDAGELLRLRSTWHGADTGETPAGPSAPEDWGTPADWRRALAVAAEFDRVPGAWKGRLEAVEVLGDDDFRLYATKLPFPLVVRAGSLEEKVGYLARLLPEIRQRYGKVRAVDLRFARRIVLQPEKGQAAAAAAPTPSRG